jgi:hypothetical protein
VPAGIPAAVLFFYLQTRDTSRHPYICKTTHISFDTSPGADECLPQFINSQRTVKHSCELPIFPFVLIAEAAAGSNQPSPAITAYYRKSPASNQHHSIQFTALRCVNQIRRRKKLDQIKDRSNYHVEKSKEK